MRNDDPMEYEKFYSIGREIKVAAENEDLPKLQELITKHKSNIPLLRLYIVDVFQSVLHFR
jgi:hypothetical protein